MSPPRRVLAIAVAIAITCFMIGLNVTAAYAAHEAVTITGNGSTSLLARVPSPVENSVSITTVVATDVMTGPNVPPCASGMPAGSAPIADRLISQGVSVIDAADIRVAYHDTLAGPNDQNGSMANFAVPMKVVDGRSIRSINDIDSRTAVSNMRVFPLRE